jgi:hypothetical protein
MAQLYTNNALSLLENSLTSSGLEIHVIPGDGVLYPQPTNPGDFFLVTLEDPHNAGQTEIVKIIQRIDDTLYIDPLVGRGFDDTTARAWAPDVLVDHRITAYTLRKIEQVKGAVTNPDDPNIVQSNQSLISDTYEVVFPNNLSCKWIVTVLHEPTGRISIAEVLAAYRPAPLTPSYTVYAKTGDNLKYTMSVVSSGSEMRLVVNNTDTVDFRINCIRLNY